MSREVDVASCYYDHPHMTQAAMDARDSCMSAAKAHELTQSLGNKLSNFAAPSNSQNGVVTACLNKGNAQKTAPAIARN